MTPAARPARRGPGRRGLQLLTATTALALTGGLVAGAVADRPGSGAEDASAAALTLTAGHHGGAAPVGTGATDGPDLAPGTRLGADGRVVHDHGDLEVTVMLGADGDTRVRGPVRPGAWISFVNHTTSDQTLTTDDGTLSVEVPLVRLVTLRAPTEPGTYRLTSATDDGVSAELVVA